jgi:DNA-binding LytR/AlgR family response regulator
MQIPVIRKGESGEDNSIILLDISDILYVSREPDRVMFHTRDGVFFNLQSLDDFELFLSLYDFFRADRVCVVNMSNIKSMDSELGLVYFDDPPEKDSKFATVAYQRLSKVKKWLQGNKPKEIDSD